MVGLFVFWTPYTVFPNFSSYVFFPVAGCVACDIGYLMFVGWFFVKIRTKTSYVFRLLAKPMGNFWTLGGNGPLSETGCQCDPRKALPWAKPRYLRHDASKSFDPFDLCAWRRRNKEKAATSPNWGDEIPVTIILSPNVMDILNCAKYDLYR